MERNDILSTKNALFTTQKCMDTINEIKSKLIKIAQEQIKLLKAA